MLKTKSARYLKDILYKFVEHFLRTKAIIGGVVLKNFSKFTGKWLCQSLFLNKVAGLRPETFEKKRLWHRCFLVNSGKLLRTPFLQNTCG